jgi:ribosomal protein L44E
MEGKEWCIRQGIWGVTDYRKEDASEDKQIARHYIRNKTGYLPLGIINPEDICMS